MFHSNLWQYFFYFRQIIYILIEIFLWTCKFSAGVFLVLYVSFQSCSVEKYPVLRCYVFEVPVTEISTALFGKTLCCSNFYIMYAAFCVMLDELRWIIISLSYLPFKRWCNSGINGPRPITEFIMFIFWRNVSNNRVFPVYSAPNYSFKLLN